MTAINLDTAAQIAAPLQDWERQLARSAAALDALVESLRRMAREIGESTRG